MGAAVGNFIGDHMPVPCRMPPSDCYRSNAAADIACSLTDCTSGIAAVPVVIISLHLPSSVHSLDSNAAARLLLARHHKQKLLRQNDVI
jgi:hypothetical protein